MKENQITVAFHSKATLFVEKFKEAFKKYLLLAKSKYKQPVFLLSFKINRLT